MLFSLFARILSNEQQSLEDAIIMLSVVNENFNFPSDYAQTFVMLKEIAEKSKKLSSEDAKKSLKNCSLPMDLRLTKHPKLESNIIFVTTWKKS